MALTDEVAQLCALEAEKKELEERIGKLRETVRQAALDELDSTGAALTWRLEGAGTVSLVTYDPKPQVYDEPAFTEFVAQIDPDAVEQIRRVRPADAERLFSVWDRALNAGALVTENGEVVPGVQLSVRPPALRVTLTRHG